MTPTQIKSLRDSFGDTQSEFYDRLGLHQTEIPAKRQTISRWGQGTRNPSNASTALLKKLAKSREP
jgi:DNA-binding transcriptional regulator YiaG